jgi:hypothetical protein
LAGKISPLIETINSPLRLVINIFGFSASLTIIHRTPKRMAGLTLP